MYPEQNQYSIDYLNQIAPDTKKTSPPNKFLVIALIVGVLAATVIGFLLLVSSSGGPTKDMQTLAARLQTVQKVANDAQKNIKSSELRAINSNLTIFLTNTNRDIVAPLMNSDVDVAKLDKAIVAAETGTELTETLEDARLNVEFDDVYVREMRLLLASITSLMERIYEGTNSTSLKEYLVSTDENLESIKKQFADFAPTIN